jgi:hypothetical protein
MSRMTISAYQVDNVIKAYSKQSKPKLNVEIKRVTSQERFTDVVTLSNNEDMKADAYKKISYNLMDVILKNNE